MIRGAIPILGQVLLGYVSKASWLRYARARNPVGPAHRAIVAGTISGT